MGGLYLTELCMCPGSSTALGMQKAIKCEVNEGLKVFSISISIP